MRYLNFKMENMKMEATDIACEQFVNINVISYMYFLMFIVVDLKLLYGLFMSWSFGLRENCE